MSCALDRGVQVAQGKIKSKSNSVLLYLVLFIFFLLDYLIYSFGITF